MWDVQYAVHVCLKTVSGLAGPQKLVIYLFDISVIKMKINYYLKQIKSLSIDRKMKFRAFLCPSATTSQKQASVIQETLFVEV